MFQWLLCRLALTPSVLRCANIESAIFKIEAMSTSEINFKEIKRDIYLMIKLIIVTEAEIFGFCLGTLQSLY